MGAWQWDTMNASPTKFVIWVALAISVAAVGCTIDGNVRTGPMQTETRTVQLGDAKTVRAEIKMGAGEMTLGGGAHDLFEGEFSYNVPSWKPEVDYSVSGSRGLLTVRQPATSGPMGNSKYKWDLHFNNQVPLELSMELGAGESTLELGTLTLSRLDVRMGVGKTIVDLAGDWKNDLQATIHGGVGEATVKLPRDVGVRVRARGGIGEIRAGELKKDGDIYTNDAYGKSSVTLNVDVEGGIGRINLELGEGPPVV
jgi:hypothetical protein